MQDLKIMKPSRVWMGNGVSETNRELAYLIILINLANWIPWLLAVKKKSWRKSYFPCKKLNHRVLSKNWRGTSIKCCSTTPILRLR